MKQQNHFIKVLAAHSYPALSGGIKLAFLRCPGIKTELSYSLDEVIKLLRQNEFNVLFIDDTLPGMDAVSRKTIIRSFPLLKIIILTISRDKEYIRSLFAEGVSGTMLTTARDHEYRKALKEGMDNKKACCSGIAELLLNEKAVLPPSEESIIQKAELTKREAEILPYLIKKIPEKIAAGKLCIDLETFKKHRKNIRKKLNKIGMLYIVNQFLKPLK